MSSKVRTIIMGTTAASLLAVSAIPAAAAIPAHQSSHHGGIAVAAIAPQGSPHGGHGGGCFAIKPTVCP